MIARRVRKGEQDKLVELCNTDSTWNKYYTGHTKWLDKALADIVNSEDRVVFGVFVSDRTLEGDYPSKLIACLFLKRAEFENTIELKNFILPDQTEYDIDLIGSLLIDKAIRFSERINAKKIEIELPQYAHHIISLFLKANYRITSIRDRYTPTDLVCILERVIGDVYVGDPFNKMEFANWLLKQYLNCNIGKPALKNNLSQIPFESNSVSKAFSNDNSVGRLKKITGILWILEHSEDGTINDDISFIIKESKKSILRLVLVDELTEKQKNKLTENNFVYFTNEEAKVIAGDQASTLSIPMDINEIGGAITVLEVEEIIKYYKQETTTYYLFSGINEGLNLYDVDDFDDDDESLGILAVYCHNWHSKAGIIGFFKIFDIEKKLFKVVLEEPIANDSALTVEDLRSYQVYNENKQIAKLKCSKMYVFKNPLPIERSSWSSSKEVEKYLMKEIVHNGNNSAYLDLKSCEKLLSNFVTDFDVEKFKNQNMILTTIAAALAAMADVAGIADYTEKKINQLKKSLNEKDELTEKELGHSLVKTVVESHLLQLKKKVEEYKKITASESNNDIAIAQAQKIIANKSLEILQLLEPFRSSIDEYDDLIKLFESVRKAL